MNAAGGWTPGWTPLAERAGYAVILAACAFWAVAAIWAMVTGPRLFAAAERQTATEVETENQSVCQRLGMPLGAGTYAACASELNGVRQQQEERLGRRSMGFI